MINLVNIELGAGFVGGHVILNAIDFFFLDDLMTLDFIVSIFKF